MRIIISGMLKVMGLWGHPLKGPLSREKRQCQLKIKSALS